jgi:hypothetical protein
MSQHQQEDQQLAEHIQAFYQFSRHVDGSPHLLAELQAQDITSSRKRVPRMMREQNLSTSLRHNRTSTRNE